MSDSPMRTPAGPPKTERWLIVVASSFIPVIAALFLPQGARIPLLVVGGVIFVAGFVLMLRHSRESSGSEDPRRLVRSESP